MLYWFGISSKSFAIEISYNIEIYLYADDTVIIFSANDDSDLQSLVNNFCSQYSNCALLIV